jgi:hypothetical protein
MLHEYWKIDTPTRRHFGGGYFDLVVWYVGMQGAAGQEGPQGAAVRTGQGPVDYGRRRIMGFQLGYGVEWAGGRTLTYLKGRYSHSVIDESKRTASPVLRAAGGFEKDRIAARFVMEAAEIDPAVRDFVLDKIKAYREEDDAGEFILPPIESEVGP